MGHLFSMAMLVITRGYNILETASHLALVPLVTAVSLAGPCKWAHRDGMLCI